MECDEQRNSGLTFRPSQLTQLKNPKRDGTCVLGSTVIHISFILCQTEDSLNSYASHLKLLIAFRTGSILIARCDLTWIVLEKFNSKGITSTSKLFIFVSPLYLISPIFMFEFSKLQCVKSINWIPVWEVVDVHWWVVPY